MVDETPPEGQQETTEDKPDEQRVPYERFQQANRKAKEAADRSKELEKSVAELKTALEEREQAGLPELERFKKDLEKAERRAAEAERHLARSTKASWVRSAAKDFTDPEDAVAFVDLDGIEDEGDAQRAVKALAKRKAHLLKPDEPQLPGQVLKNGQAVPAAAVPASGPDLLAEAQALADGLKQFASR
jgi:hypothetical protein